MMRRPPSPMRQTTTRRFIWTARTPEEFERRAPRVTLLDGSRGRIELTAKRVGGICPVPIAPVIGLPLVGSTLASHMAPTGTVVTNRGGIGVCDGFIEWALPVGQAQQGLAGMGAPVALVVVIGAIGAALIALGWALSQLRGVVDAVVAAGPLAVTAFSIALIAGAGLVVLGVLRGRR